MRLLATFTIAIDDDGQRVTIRLPWTIRIALPLALLAASPLFFAMAARSDVRDAILFGMVGVTSLVAPIYVWVGGSPRLGVGAVFDRTTGMTTIGRRAYPRGRLTRLVVERHEVMGHHSFGLVGDLDGRRVRFGRAQTERHRAVLEQVAASLAAVVSPSGTAVPEHATGPVARAAVGALGAAISFNRSFGSARLRLAAWTTRLLWAPCLLWGLYDVVRLWRGSVPAAELERAQTNAGLRTTMGVVLFLIWLFLFRRRGRFTANRGGRLER